MIDAIRAKDGATALSVTKTNTTAFSHSVELDSTAHAPQTSHLIDLHGYDQAPAQPSQALDALLRALGGAGEHIPEGAEQWAGLYPSRESALVHP